MVLFIGLLAASLWPTSSCPSTSWPHGETPGPLAGEPLGGPRPWVSLQGQSEISTLQQRLPDLPQQLLVETILATEPHNRMDGAPDGLFRSSATHLPAAGPPWLQEFWLAEQPRQGGVRLIAALPQAGHHLLGVPPQSGWKGKCRSSSCECRREASPARVGAGPDPADSASVPRRRPGEIRKRSIFFRKRGSAARFSPGGPFSDGGHQGGHLGRKDV